MKVNPSNSRLFSVQFNEGMDESIMLEWDKLQPLTQQINQSIPCDKFIEDQSLFTNATAIRNNASNIDQLGFLEQENSYWNNYNSKPITLEFGGDFLSGKISTEKNLINYNGLTKKRNETSCYNKRHLQGGKMVKKVIVPPNNGQDHHIIAERKRREKLNQRFVELSSIIPCLGKTDKASILIDAVMYIKELEDKVKTLETQNPKPIDSVVLVKTSSLSSTIDHGRSSFIEPLPKIEARFLDNNILISIHCVNAKGVLVKILSEIEEINFIVTHTNLMSFPGCTAFISLTAQIEEGFVMNMEDVVRKLKSALNEFGSGNQGN